MAGIQTNLKEIFNESIPIEKGIRVEISVIADKIREDAEASKIESD